MKIKTGQKVKVLSGKDKGKEGKVIQVFPKLQKVVVEGVNKSFRHIPSRRQGEKGERIEYFSPIHVSNVKAMAEAEKKGAKKDSKKTEEKEVKKTTKKTAKK